MTTQPEALRLADYMDHPLNDPNDVADAVSSELRRLHAECNDLAHQLNESNERNGRLKAQRDALLEALKYIAKEFRQHGRQHWPEAIAARLAIEAVEGEKK